MTTTNCPPPRDYQVPGNPHTDVYLLPVSGGADSSALAILLHEIAPHVPFRMVFTDTGAEERETLETLERLETWIGKPIERLGEKSLFDLIAQYKGFLPSPKDRVLKPPIFTYISQSVSECLYISSILEIL